MRCLGIDPGLSATGYGCVETVPPTSRRSNGTDNSLRLVEAGVLRLTRKSSLQSRLAELHADLCELLEQLRPSVMVVEKMYAHYRHPATAIRMGHARGVILLAAAQHNIEVRELAATEVKKAITGFGHAGKAQIQEAVRVQCGLAKPPRPADVADAIAIALVAARRMERVTTADIVTRRATAVRSRRK